jgi:hypothetical protein
MQEGRMLRINSFAPAILASLVATLVVAATVATSRSARAADDCIAKPNAAAPQGSHWYYRVDRTTHRPCWFLGAQGAKVRRAATAKPPASARPVALNAATTSVEPPAASAPTEAAAGPDAAFAVRWADPVAASDATERAPASDSYAAEPWRMPDTIAARPVPTITLRKDAEPATAEPAPAATEGANMVPGGALAGVALVLAIVGGVLLKLAARSDRYELEHFAENACPGPRINARPGLDPGSAAGIDPGRVPVFRRKCDQIKSFLALPGAGRHIRSRTDADSGIPRRAMQPASDIAAATLQPDMVVTAPEPIRTADDIEHSLRQLLQEWQRLAA